MTQPWPNCGGLAEPHTWASEQTHHPWGAEQFWQTGSKWTGAVKSLCHKRAAFPVTSVAVWPRQPDSLWAFQLHKHKPFFFPNTSVKKWRKKRKKKSLMSLNSNCDHALHHIHRLCDVIVYATSHTVQNTISWELSCGPNCCSLSPRVPLQFDFFFYPLLKECHGCSANTKPWVCLRAYPSPSAHTIALFSLAHPLTACTVQAKKNTETFGVGVQALVRPYVARFGRRFL